MLWESQGCVRARGVFDTSCIALIDLRRQVKNKYFTGKQRVSETTLFTGVGPTELFLWQMCQQYAREYPNPRHPVRTELIGAFVPRLVRRLLLQQLASDVTRLASALELPVRSQGAPVPEAANLLKMYNEELVSQIVELDSYLHEPGIN